jgi:hypothetical protein
MARLKEQIALSRFKDAATVVFDNESESYDDTTGRGLDGAANKTITWDDVVDMAAVLMAEKHIPTDFILHPLMWSVFLKDAIFHYGGAASAVNTSWGYRPQNVDNALNATAPMGLNVLVSPFVSFTAKTSSVPALSDIFLIDRNEIGTLLVKDDMSTDQFDDPARDIRQMKMKERYDIVMLGDGEGITVAKNVRLARNYEILVTNESA